MKRKDLFKTRLLTLAALCGFMLSLASCANEEVVQNTTDADGNSDKNLTTFVTGTDPETRTSMDYNTGDFYWEAGDRIWVQDDSNQWQKSSNAPTARTAYFKFKVPGKFTAKSSYKVYYPGLGNMRNEVALLSEQRQLKPNSTAHFGASGDCGMGDAKRVAGKAQFEFKLDHQVTYLVFLPYTNHAILKNCYLTKVEVLANKEIANTSFYKLDPSTGDLVSYGTSNYLVTLITGGINSSTNPKGFPLTNTSADVNTNGAFMVIKPGTYDLVVRYWVKDMVTNVEGTITKRLSSRTYEKNKFYNMTANLDVRDYDGDHYYQWDAQEQYWKGYEWTKNLPEGQGQPTINLYSSDNYPKYNTDIRYYHQGYGTPFNATYSCAVAPNCNEMSWYVMKGNPLWDEDELWTSMGHLRKGGMWFLKKANIPGYSKEYAADGATDLRIDWRTDYIKTPDRGFPGASIVDKYFYLPALGFYGGPGSLDVVGSHGFYWSSNAVPEYYAVAGSLEFNATVVKIYGANRDLGYRAQSFTDFGED